MRIALVPLDDRPVNTELVRDVIAIAGADVDIPPASLLPDYRTPGDADALGEWLLATSQRGLDAAVVSLDMLGYGGLIPSRTNHDSLRDVLQRISVLERIHETWPAVRLGALNVFLRASNSNSASEEPEYWTGYGKLLHSLGARVHAEWLDRLGHGPASVSTTEIPDGVRRDFALRRLRNHSLNLAGLELLHAGTVDTLLLTADDTAPLSAGSAEQVLVDYWRTLLGPHGDDLLVYPGADEVAAVMAARMLGRHHGVVATFAITCIEPEGLHRVAPFENVPLGTTVARQIQAVGARQGSESADIELVVHAPSPDGGDLYDSLPRRTSPELIQATVDAVEAALKRDRQVAVADCRWPNGGDPDLVQALVSSGLIGRLVAYGGWNTAGNTIGSTVAAAATAVIGQSSGTFDAEAQRRFLLTRVTEDYGYQSVARHELIHRGHGSNDLTLDGSRGDAEAEAVRSRLNDVLREVDPGWEVTSVRFPWRRTFEIGLRLEPVTKLTPN